MKVCPVCNETFADELKFCDLDGTRLKREVGSETPEKQNKTWSLIGVGLLVGALVLSAISIIFLPKARIAPSVASSESGTAMTSTRTEPAQTEIAQATSPDSQTPEIVLEEAPLVEPKKKDPTQQNINGNVNAESPNPKAAAKAASEDEAPTQVEPITVAPPPKDPEPPPPVVRPTADARDAGSAPASAEMKRDPKRDSSKANEEDKKAEAKKTEDKKKKKGGGLFGAFKKIFGKD